MGVTIAKFDPLLSDHHRAVSVSFNLEEISESQEDGKGKRNLQEILKECHRLKFMTQGKSSKELEELIGEEDLEDLKSIGQKEEVDKEICKIELLMNKKAPRGNNEVGHRVEDL